MADGIINLDSTSSKLEARIVWNSQSNGSSENSSNVFASFQIRRTDGYSTRGNWTGELGIDEETQSFTVSTTVGGDFITLKEFTKYNVKHNDDGSGTCSISAWCDAPSGTSLSGQSVNGGENVGLDKIARYLKIISFEVRNITINTAQVFWNTDVPRNGTYFYLNNGSEVGSSTYGETVASDGRSGMFNIKNLEPNKSYSIKIKCIRSDNSLATTSENKSFATAQIATINQASNFNIGTNPTIKWNNPSNCKTTVYAENIVNGKVESTLSREVDVSGKNTYTYSLNANTLYSKVPNSNSGTIRYGIKSINDGKSYYNSIEKKYFVINSNPDFSKFVFKDTNSKTLALTGNNQKFIKRYSNLQVTVSTANKAVAKNYASMKNYTLTVGTKNSGEVSYSSTADVNLSVNAIDNNIIFVTAKDSRQNTTAVQATINNSNYYNYTNLTITKCTLTRADGGVGTQVTLNYEGNIWNNSFGKVKNDIASIKYEYKIAGSKDWKIGKTVLSPTISGNKYSQTVVIQGDLDGTGFNEENNYDFRLTVSDKLTAKQFTTIFGAGKPLLAYHKNGIAIGGKYDTDINAILQILGNLKIKTGDIVLNDNGKIQINENIGSNTFKSGCGIASGTDGANAKSANMRLFSWYGIGFAPSISGQKIPQGENAVYIDCRSGNVTARGSISSEDGTLQAKPETLYSNSAGSTTNITLAKSTENYSFVEIYYVDTVSQGDIYHSVKVSEPNGKIVSLFNLVPQNESAFDLRFNSKAVKIDKNKILNLGTYYYCGWIHASSADFYHSNELKIVKVLGYR